MNWSRSKTIFIILFAIVNVVLMSYVLFEELSSNYISETDVLELQTYMDKQNIEINDHEIMRWMPKIKNIELENVISTNCKFLEQFSTKGDIDSSGENTLQSDDGKTLHISENAFKFEDSSAFDSDIFESGNIDRQIIKYLKHMGFELTDIILTDGIKSDNAYEVSISKKAGNLFIRDVVLNVICKNDGSMKLSGFWLNVIHGGKYEKQNILPITDVLVDFIRDLRKETTDAVAVTDISLVYHIGESAFYHKIFTAVGMWKITLSSGAVYYYDVRK